MERLIKRPSSKCNRCGVSRILTFGVTPHWRHDRGMKNFKCRNTFIHKVELKAMCRRLLLDFLNKGGLVSFIRENDYRRNISSGLTWKSNFVYREFTIDLACVTSEDIPTVAIFLDEHNNYNLSTLYIINTTHTLEKILLIPKHNKTTLLLKDYKTDEIAYSVFSTFELAFIMGYLVQGQWKLDPYNTNNTTIWNEFIKRKQCIKCLRPTQCKVGEPYCISCLYDLVVGYPTEIKYYSTIEI